MAAKQQKKRGGGMASVRDFLGKYRLGVDFWAAGLFELLLLPNFVWWFYSPANDVLRTAQSDVLEIFAHIFEAFTLLVFILVVRKEHGPFSFFSPYAVFCLLSVILYYAAWIFYFTAYVNAAVLLFLAVLPCTAIGCLAALRKNYFALLPLLVFFALHLTWTCIHFL